MQSTCKIVGALLVMLALAAPVAAQAVGGGNCCIGVGTLKSASVVVPKGSVVPTPVFTVPATGHFILTGVSCQQQTSNTVPSEFLPTISMTSTPFGPIPCQVGFVFTPGLALPPGTKITCSLGSNPLQGSCTITGVLQ
jgi:hypothetical protein